MDETSKSEAIRKLFEQTRRRLVETGTRNRLIHVNRQNRRSNTLEVVNEKTDEVYRILALSGKTMRFLATGKDKDGESDTPNLAIESVSVDQEANFKDDQLETRLGPDGLQKRLLKLARDAKTAEEEQGVNILFLAMGFLTWYEDPKSDVKREAPLLLLPVELVRNNRTSTFDLRFRDEDISTNLSLQERLKGDFGIDLPNIDTNDGWMPNSYFDKVEEVVAIKSRWSIDRDGMQLGFFSFAKLLMFRDLDPINWPNKALEQHPLTTGLLYERFESEKPLFGVGERLDERLQPEILYHVVDADSSQAKVIEEVRSGRNLVVQGPPGTGKSQTITNIISAAVKDGKRVLFVAEKMAALAVVHKRLVDVGLSDICLELHSKSANKKAILAELAKTLNAARAIPEAPEKPETLRIARDRLNAIEAQLHKRVGQSGESAFEALAIQVHFRGQLAPVPSMPIAGLADIDSNEAKKLSSEIASFGNIIAETGPLNAHPFFGVGELELQPNDLARLSTKLVNVAEEIGLLKESIQEAAIALGIEVKPTLSATALLTGQLSAIGDAPKISDQTLGRLVELHDKARLRQNLEWANRWQIARHANELTFSDQAWRYDAASIRSALAVGKRSWFARWGAAYRRASHELAELLNVPLPKSAGDRTQLADILIEIASLRDAWRDDEEWCKNELHHEWRGEKTAFQALSTAIDWAQKASSQENGASAASIIELAKNPALRFKLRGELVDRAKSAKAHLDKVVHDLQLCIDQAFQATACEDADLAAVEQKILAIATNSGRYDEWINLQRLRNRLVTSNLHALVGELESGEMSGQVAQTEFLYGRAEAIWKLALSESVALADLRNTNRHEIVEKFQKLEVQRRRDCVKDIRMRHLSQVPQGAQGAMGFIRGEIGKKKAHAPIRKLMLQAGQAVQRIKPVLMMSPISVAQFLPPTSIDFDLLVIDEASQVKPEDALGAIARAHQIVVVGDQKQLPPSSFFDRLSDGENQDEEDDELALLDGAAKVGDLESILTLCEARGLPQRMLEWHYRSRDPSLIKVSNSEFYGGRLVLPPSPLQNNPNYGLIFTRIAGIYDRGGKRDNRIEAEALVNRIAEHARNFPDLSLGIVTFSFAQRNLITELLEYHRRQSTELDVFLREGGSEDVFVKNIENVQGDERDVILVSVGYGPSVTGGKLTMSFGPVNNEGGERRLNVLFTRARVRCEVFCSFDPADMDLTKTKLEGPRVLKRFLDYAKTGILTERIATGAEPDTPFEADIANEIRRLGYLVDHQVGTAGFFIDLGIRHPESPGTYILAVECDGATYHGALWARERDRLRQEVLEHLGWSFHRIWSTDWFYRRATELERLKSALHDALRTSKSNAEVPVGHNNSKLEPQDSRPLPVEQVTLVEAHERTMPLYQRVWISVNTHLEPHEVPTRSLSQLAVTVVETEGPVHEEEVARRIAVAFGKEKAGSRILDATKRALKLASQSTNSQIVCDGKFWFTATQATDPPVRNRSNEAHPVTSAANISDLELLRSLEIAFEDNAGGADAELIRAASRLLGFKRVGPELNDRLTQCMNRMIK